MVISESQLGETTDYTYGLERISAISGNTRTEYVYDGRGSVAAEVSYNDSWYTFGGNIGADYNGRQMGALNYDGYDGGSGKNSTAPKKTTIPSSSATPPRTYTNPYQEYVNQRHAATTPSAQDCAQLMRSGLHMSYAQYAYEKSHTVFPPYQEYMQGKAMGSPYYVTSTSSSVSCIAYPANHPQYPNQYYVRARNKEEHITSSPKVTGMKTFALKRLNGLTICMLIVRTRLF